MAGNADSITTSKIPSKEQIGFMFHIVKMVDFDSGRD